MCLEKLADRFAVCKLIVSVIVSDVSLSEISSAAAMLAKRLLLYPSWADVMVPDAR